MGTVCSSSGVKSAYRLPRYHLPLAPLWRAAHYQLHIFSCFFKIFFEFTRSRLQSHEGEFGVCWWWGCLHSADLWSRCRCTFLLYLLLLWHAAHPRSECSAGGPVIICLLLHLPSCMVRGPCGPAYHLPFCSIWGGPSQLIICLSALFAPAMAREPSLEQASVGRSVFIFLCD